MTGRPAIWMASPSTLLAGRPSSAIRTLLAALRTGSTRRNSGSRNRRLSFCALEGPASTTTLVQEPVELRPVFLDQADADAGNRQQLGGCLGAARRHGHQRLV